MGAAVGIVQQLCCMHAGIFLCIISNSFASISQIRRTEVVLNMDYGMGSLDTAGWAELEP